MIFTFLMGIAAGALFPLAEPHLRQFVENVAMRDLGIKQTEYDVLTLLVLMLAGTFLSAIFVGYVGAFPMILGAVLGLFGKRILAAIRGDGEEDA